MEKTGLCPLISSREGEILLVDLAPLIDIGVQVNLRGFDGGMTEVFLDYTGRFFERLVDAQLAYTVTRSYGE